MIAYEEARASEGLLIRERFTLAAAFPLQRPVELGDPGSRLVCAQVAGEESNLLTLVHLWRVEYDCRLRGLQLWLGYVKPARGCIGDITPLGRVSAHLECDSVVATTQLVGRHLECKSASLISGLEGAVNR